MIERADLAYLARYADNLEAAAATLPSTVAERSRETAAQIRRAVAELEQLRAPSESLATQEA